MALNVENAEMFEASKSAQMEQQQYRYHLAVGNFRGALGRLAQNEAFCGIIEFLAKLISYTENIGNFIVCNHSGYCC